MSLLGSKLLTLHHALDASRIPHAFGGAIALAYCTRNPRATSDLDINVFTDSDRSPSLLAALPPQVSVDAENIQQLRNEAQTRLWWDETPVDVFLNTHAFHLRAEAEVRSVPFEGATIPVLGCQDLATFKALFDRPKDWVDIADMVDTHAIDPLAVAGTIHDLLGDDPRVERLSGMA